MHMPRSRKNEKLDAEYKKGYTPLERVDRKWPKKKRSYLLPHPLSFILHPSSFILHRRGSMSNVIDGDLCDVAPACNQPPAFCATTSKCNTNYSEYLHTSETHVRVYLAKNREITKYILDTNAVQPHQKYCQHCTCM